MLTSNVTSSVVRARQHYWRTAHASRGVYWTALSSEQMRRRRRRAACDEICSSGAAAVAERIVSHASDVRAHVVQHGCGALVDQAWKRLARLTHVFLLEDARTMAKIEHLATINSSAKLLRRFDRRSGAPLRTNRAGNGWHSQSSADADALLRSSQACSIVLYERVARWILHSDRFSLQYARNSSE